MRVHAIEPPPAGDPMYVDRRHEEGEIADMVLVEYVTPPSTHRQVALFPERCRRVDISFLFCFFDVRASGRRAESRDADHRPRRVREQGLDRATRDGLVDRHDVPPFDLVDRIARDASRSTPRPARRSRFIFQRPTWGDSLTATDPRSYSASAAQIRTTARPRETGAASARDRARGPSLAGGRFKCG